MNRHWCIWIHDGHVASDACCRRCGARDARCSAAMRLSVPPRELITEMGLFATKHQGAASLTQTLPCRSATAAAGRTQAEITIAMASHRRSQPRVDIPGEGEGGARLRNGRRSSGMLHATMRHAPLFGSGVSRIRNERAVRDAKGVVDVAVIDGRHVAVIANSWWQAEQAAWLLDIEWTSTEAGRESSAEMRSACRRLLAFRSPIWPYRRGERRCRVGGSRHKDSGSRIQRSLRYPCLHGIDERYCNLTRRQNRRGLGTFSEPDDNAGGRRPRHGLGWYKSSRCSAPHNNERRGLWTPK